MNPTRLAVLAALGMTLSAAAVAQAPPTPQPAAPTLAAGPATVADRIFYEQIVKAIQTNNQDWLSTVIRYPLRVTLRSTRVSSIANATAFKQHYGEIFDAALRTAFTLQDENTLMRTPNGIPIGGGRLWFEPIYVTAPGMATQRYLITAINN